MRDGDLQGASYFIIDIVYLGLFSKSMAFPWIRSHFNSLETKKNLHPSSPCRFSFLRNRWLRLGRWNISSEHSNPFSYSRQSKVKNRYVVAKKTADNVGAWRLKFYVIKMWAHTTWHENLLQFKHSIIKRIFPHVWLHKLLIGSASVGLNFSPKSFGT